MYDSVFSRFTSSKETTILPEKKIKEQLEALEKKAIALLTKNYAQKIKRIGQSFLEGKAELGINIELSRNLWGLWLLGLNKGESHGDSEISQSNVVKFRQNDPQPSTIRNIKAEQAIKRRINTLAKDVNDSEWKEIKKAIEDAIKPQSANLPPISRKELLNRIEITLGEKKNRYRDRAQTIARTELTFAYNAGRLNSYIESGLVGAVRFVSILDERRCPQCLSRQGVVVNLDDEKGLATIMPPVHPKCRCVISPVLRENLPQVEDTRRIENRQIITDVAPWLITGILSAILLSEKNLVSQSAAVAAVASKIAEPVATAETTTNIVRYDVRTPILLSEKVDLQKTSFAEMRSLFTKEQLSDKQILKILSYRDTYGLNSVEDVRSLLSGQEANLLRSLSEKHQVLSFLDPKVNSSAMVLWVRSGGILSKAEARSLYKQIQQKAPESLEDLEQVLNRIGMRQEIITKLSARATEKQKAQLAQLQELQSLSQSAGQIVPLPVGKGAIVPVIRKPPRPATAPSPGKGARLSAIDNSITDIGGQISLLKSRIESRVKGVVTQNGTTDLLIRSREGVTTSEAIASELKDGLAPYGESLTNLNNQVSGLEEKLAALLDPGVEDYFTARANLIPPLREEIQRIRGAINESNRLLSQQKRAVQQTDKQLRIEEKQVRAALPDYSEIAATIQAQIEDIAARLDTEAIREQGSVAVSALRARYRTLVAQLEEISSLTSRPLKEYSGDKKASIAYLGEGSGATRNLSDRLSRLEERIERLPSSPKQLSPSRRKAYQKMPTAITRSSNYVPPVRVAPGVQGAQARLAKASRASLQAHLDNAIASFEVEATSLAQEADRQFLTKKQGRKGTPLSKIEKAQSALESQSVTASTTRQTLNTTAKQSSSVVMEIEEGIDNLIKSVTEDIYSPLGNSWFNEKGVIDKTKTAQIRNLTKQADNFIGKIDKAIATTKNVQKKISELTTEIDKLLAASESIALDKEKLEQLTRKAELLKAELDGVSKFEVNAVYYNNQLREHQAQLSKVIKGDSSLLSSRTREELKSLRQKYQLLEDSLSPLENAGAFSSLAQARAYLQAQKERLKSFPRRIADLPESARIEWEETRGVREVTKKATQSLNSQLENYRSLVKNQKETLQQLRTKIDESLSDIENSSVYTDSLEQSIKQQQNEIKASIAELDENLKLLSLAYDPEQGLQLVYSDLKKIYNSDIPGLAFIKEEAFPVGLDEAMEVKRKVIDFLLNRGKQLEAKINGILEGDRALATSRYKLSVVESQLQEVADLEKALSLQKDSSVKIEQRLKEVFFSDPVLYRELKPATLLEEVQENAVSYSIELKRLRERLADSAAQLSSDIKQIIPYGVRDKAITEIREGIPITTSTPSAYFDSSGIKKIVDEYKAAITGLNTSRRSQIEQIGITLKSNRIKLYGKNSISENLRQNKPLTPGQQKVFDGLSKEQRDILVEASRTGVLDLYDSLYKLSVTKGKLEDDVIETTKNLFTSLGLTDGKRVKRSSIKSQKFAEISSHLNKLRGMGYQGLSIEIGEKARFVGMDAPPQSLVARQQWELLRKKLGVDREGNPLPTNPTITTALGNGTLVPDDLSILTYNDILDAIAVNRQLRYEINNRLSAFNFQRQRSRLFLCKK